MNAMNSGDVDFISQPQAKEGFSAEDEWQLILLLFHLSLVQA